MGLRQRGNAIRTVDELAEIKGFDADVLARIAPDLTVFPDVTAGFDPKLASPRAQAVMSTGDTPASGASAFGPPQSPTQFPTPALDASNSNIGRPFTITLDVDDGRGGRLHRVVIIELTGLPNQPVWIRAFT